ncbi:hypothetical protein NE865_04565 [Phthorimaea operculella]|nr:hypothetical protein NE865_04565 [Phthorimaea operculella]
MLSCCWPRHSVAPAPPAPPPPPLAPDLVADLPLNTRDSSAFTSYEDEKKPLEEEKQSLESVVFGETTHVDIPADEVDDAPPPPRSPSIRVEDYSEKSNPSIHSTESQKKLDDDSNEFGSQKSLSSQSAGSPVHRSQSRKSTRSPLTPKSRSVSPSPTKSARSGHLTPEPVSDVYEPPPAPCERDVRNALSECIIPAKHEDWEVIVNSLIETERLASDASARAPAASWRAVVRSAAAHVRSLRSRVARTACSTLGALFEHRGRALDPELEDSATALLERCADVNRFLRADAASALVRIACGSNSARAAVALSRRGASHRAGPVRAAAAQALAKLVQHNGPSRVLDMPSEPRTILLRAAGELLGDANPEARVHGRQLCLALAEDVRFHPMLKEAMLPSRYRAIEKFVDKLRCR